jgi:signal transduction histidine kinase
MGTHNAETLLVVEDEPAIANLQCRALARAGYQTLAAESENAALETLSRETVNLVILDYRLPGVRTGLELFADLRAAGHPQPVIMVTGYGDETIVIDALRAGVRDFVIKSSEYLEYLPLAVERVLLQIRLEHRLDEADRQIRHAQKMDAIGKLAGGVAHEFNNLLQTIEGYTRFAIEGLDASDRRRQDLDLVLAASEQAAHLTRQLLDFSRRESLEMADVDLNAIIRGLIEMIHPLIGEQISVDLRLAENIGPVRGSAAQIQQMLMNLCVNARDAMPDGGCLTIQTQYANRLPNCCGSNSDSHAGQYVLISVADAGCGMTADVKNRIFEPFFTTKDVGKGTGLGLAMVYGAVKQHQGHIHVDSTPGAGTTFKIYLPAQGATGSASAPANN